MLQLSATRTTDIQHPQTRAISLKLVARRALLRHTNTKHTSWWLSEAANVINWFVTRSRHKTKTLRWKCKSVAWIYLWHSLKDAEANFTDSHSSGKHLSGSNWHSQETVQLLLQHQTPFCNEEETTVHHWKDFLLRGVCVMGEYRTCQRRVHTTGSVHV